MTHLHTPQIEMHWTYPIVGVACYQGNGRGVVSHLVDGENATDDHLRPGGDQGGEHEARTVTEKQPLRDVEGLEVFGAAWSC